MILLEGGESPLKCSYSYGIIAYTNVYSLKEVVSLQIQF